MKVCEIWIGLLFLYSGGDVSDATHRIIGGHETTIEEHPYIVQVQLGDHHHCGATLIHPRMVLTAAHCIVAETQEYVLRFGTNQRTVGGLTRRTPDFLIHPNYKANLQNDIAVIIFEIPILIDVTTQLAKLPEKDRQLHPGQSVNASGWGYTILDGKTPQPDILNTVELEIISHDTCQAAYEPFVVTDGMLCAGNPEYTKSACTLDSGGPLVANGTVYGITAGSIKCGSDGVHPGVYTKVVNYLNFISEKMKLVE